MLNLVYARAFRLWHHRTPEQIVARKIRTASSLNNATLVALFICRGRRDDVVNVGGQVAIVLAYSSAILLFFTTVSVSFVGMASS